MKVVGVGPGTLLCGDGEGTAGDVVVAPLHNKSMLTTVLHHIAYLCVRRSRAETYDE